MSYRAWTAEDDNLIRRMREEGHSSAIIAAALGNVSRSAVCGRAYRLKQMGEIVPDTQRTAAAIARAERRKIRAPWKPPVARTAAVVETGKSKDIVYPKPVVAVSAPHSIISKRVTIFELERCMCRAPLWGRFASLPVEQKFYCGAPADGGSWCIEHHAKMFGEGTRSERRATLVEGLAA